MIPTNISGDACPSCDKSYGTSPYAGIAQDIPMPIVRTGQTNIEDVDGQD